MAPSLRKLFPSKWVARGFEPGSQNMAARALFWVLPWPHSWFTAFDDQDVPLLTTAWADLGGLQG